MDTLEFARTIITFLEDKKGEDILLLDIRELADFADFFVICNGTSDRMLDALADGVLEGVREKYHQKGRVEGHARDGWVLLDYGDIIVHLFAPDRRAYYRLEDLWSGARVLLRLQ